MEPTAITSAGELMLVHAAAHSQTVKQLTAMDDPEDDILARELGKVGSFAGSSAARGASFAARYLPTETFSESFRIQADADHIRKTTIRILSGMGRISDEMDHQSLPAIILAVVGSGFFKMNPTSVQVQVVSSGESDSDVIISAAAKEGLIKQRSAEKAVRRIRAALSEVYP